MANCLLAGIIHYILCIEFQWIHIYSSNLVGSSIFLHIYPILNSTFVHFALHAYMWCACEFGFCYCCYRCCCCCCTIRMCHRITTESAVTHTKNKLKYKIARKWETIAPFGYTYIFYMFYCNGMELKITLH